MQRKSLPGIQQIQQQDLAGKTKLTAVSIYSNGRTHQAFVMCKHDSNGKAILPESTLLGLAANFRLRSGQTFSHE